MNKSTEHGKQVLTERLERVRLSLGYARDGVVRTRAELQAAEEHLAKLQVEEADLGYSISLLDK